MEKPLQNPPTETVQEKDNTSDQDFNQRVNVASTLMLELYRVLMGAFLVIFVPQNCDDTVCSIDENIDRSDVLSRIALSFNAFTFLAFLALYAIEVKRENTLITYLEVNKFNSGDDVSVGEALQKLDPIKKDLILNFDQYYQKVGYSCSGIFIANSVLSSIVVYSNYLDSKTITVYLTNLLFMSLKVYDVYNTVNTKPNIFYSAYMKNKIQFNDVDPDKKIDTSEVKS